MNLSATLLAIVATSILGTNVALNLLRMSMPKLPVGQTIVCGYVIGMIFCVLWGGYTGDIQASFSRDPIGVIAGYVLAGWATLMGSVLVHEITKKAESKRDDRRSTVASTGGTNGL